LGRLCPIVQIAPYHQEQSISQGATWSVAQHAEANVCLVIAAHGGKPCRGRGNGPVLLNVENLDGMRSAQAMGQDGIVAARIILAQVKTCIVFMSMLNGTPDWVDSVCPTNKGHREQDNDR
jgi:hypothetical protein